MERKRYLELCQKVAVLPSGILGIKENIPDELKVVCDGIVYYPWRRVAGFDNKGNLQLYAILHDLKTHSTMEVPLKFVKENKK